MFITLEGGEGSGKSTLISKIEKELRSWGKEVVVSREPGGTELGEYIRNCLLNPDLKLSFGYKAELLLFLASRAEHIEKLILPALASGKIVLCDRFNDSSVAYQGGGRELGVDYVLQLCDLICGRPIPDITLFLDVDPSIGLKRLPGGYDRLEQEKSAFHRRVREAFLELQQRFPKRIYIIDAGKPFDEVLRKAFEIIKKCF